MTSQKLDRGNQMSLKNEQIKKYRILNVLTTYQRKRINQCLNHFNCRFSSITYFKTQLRQIKAKVIVQLITQRVIHNEIVKHNSRLGSNMGQFRYYADFCYFLHYIMDFRYVNPSCYDRLEKIESSSLTIVIMDVLFDIEQEDFQLICINFMVFDVSHEYSCSLK